MNAIASLVLKCITLLRNPLPSVRSKVLSSKNIAYIPAITILNHCNRRVLFRAAYADPRDLKGIQQVLGFETKHGYC